MQHGVSDVAYLAYCVEKRVNLLSSFVRLDNDHIEFQRTDLIEHIIEKTIEILEERANGTQTDQQSSD